MIIFLSQLQKEHLNMIHQHSTQVLVDCCKISIDYLHNGVVSKKIGIAAEKLNKPIPVIQNLVQALLYLIVEGCKHNLSEPDFRSSLALAGFSSDHQEVLVKFYAAKKSSISTALQLIQQRDPTYQDLDWRFEVMLFSRHSKEEVKPTVAMDFVLMTPKSINQSNEAKTTSRNVNTKTTNANPSSVVINSSIQDAKAASHCENVISHVFLQCNLPNLLHLTDTLEQACKESKSQHVRKVQRAL